MEKLETTSRGRHALTAMVDLSKRQNTKPVPLSEIAQSRQISLSYLEQIFAGLRRHGIVKSHRGPGGGYLMAKPATEITVSSIIKAAEDSPIALRTERNIRRERQMDTPTEKLWEQVNGFIYRQLDQISLQDVITENLEIYQKVFKTKG